MLAENSQVRQSLQHEKLEHKEIRGTKSQPSSHQHLYAMIPERDRGL